MVTYLLFEMSMNGWVVIFRSPSGLIIQTGLELSALLVFVFRYSFVINYNRSVTIICSLCVLPKEKKEGPRIRGVQHAEPPLAANSTLDKPEPLTIISGIKERKRRKAR